MSTIISSPLDFNVDDLYVDLTEALALPLYLKCEGFNFAGSVKMKAAIRMVETMEREGRLRPGGTFIESSSGNMGVALSIVAARKGYRFVCVTDVRSTPTTRRMMSALGAKVHVIAERDKKSGFLGSRLATVRRICESNKDFVWLNQYANPANWYAHYGGTGPQIAAAFADLDILFVGAGTTGTLMGCARYFREFRPDVKVVAVDAIGSVTFGGHAGDRLLPGLGTSVRPESLDKTYIYDVIHVAETDSIAMCRTLAKHGYVFGGSTGTVVHGAVTWLRRYRADVPTVAVAISPDLGANYAGTIYNPEWVARHYGDAPELSQTALDSCHDWALGTVENQEP